MTIEPARGPEQKLEEMSTSSSPVAARGPVRRDGETMAALLERRVGGGTPYFALTGIEFDGTELRAEAPTETEPGAELGPVSAAELARHAVVAGLSAVALGRPDGARCYYLVSAIDATLFPNDAPYGTRIKYSALATEQGPVGGAAQIEARLERELLARVHASFAIVPETLFLRLFTRHRTATYGDIGSHRTYPPLDLATSDRHSAHARLTIPTSACRGHFEQHPALPVSGLVGLLVRLAGSLVEGQFRVTSLRARSQAVAWAGDELKLRVAKTTGPFHFAGHAAVGGRTIANVSIGVAHTPRE